MWRAYLSRFRTVIIDHRSRHPTLGADKKCKVTEQTTISNKFQYLVSKNSLEQ